MHFAFFSGSGLASRLRGLLCIAAVLCLWGAGAVRAQDAAGTYVVKEGDTLYRIARDHDLTVARLRALNGLEGSAIYPGQELRLSPAEAEETSDVPASSADVPPAAPAPTSAPFYGSHRAAPGATFYTIAARYGTPVDSLVALNAALLDTAGAFLEEGTEVRLPASLGPPAHTVAAGETIYDVAQRYRVSAKLIQRTNDLDAMTVREGQRLRIPGRAAPRPQPSGTRRPVRERGPVARYPAAYEGRLMAGGAPYDPEQFVVSHPTLPMGAVVLLTVPSSGRQTFARVADRGPLDEAFVMDVSAAVHRRLGLPEDEAQAMSAAVEVRVMD